MPNEENRNYNNLLDQAEGAFLKKEYLEAFLIQSCIIEGVVKNYALSKLKTLTDESAVLARKIKSFELARLIDTLFITENIEVALYHDLNLYREKRNKVIHDILQYEDKNRLDQELKETFELGRFMKGWMVKDMATPGITVAQRNAQIAALLSQIAELQKVVINQPESETKSKV